MPNYRIAPSILSADFACLGQEVSQVVTAGADLIHVDVMDNHYVPNLTFGSMICAALKRYGIKTPLDVHLMIKPVDAIIPDFAKAGASIITFHPEATEHPHRTIQLIRQHGCQVGIALNPGTPLNVLDHLLIDIDMVLIMSVNPGFGGQTFIPQILMKITQLRQKILNEAPQVRIEVDGGIKADNIAAIAKAGADTFVAGSAIFEHKNYAEAIQTLRDQLKTIR